MKIKGWIIFLVIAVILILIVVSSYNKMISLSVTVDESWAQVENQLQRRFDLIPNLVETAKGYMKFEQETLIEVTKARASVGQAQTINEKINANNQLEGALARLLVVFEKYPDLKANENFITLMAELSGTENRIAVERQRYNQRVREYNTYIKKFPNLIIASIFNFKEKPYFKAANEAEQAPKVQF
ncbi:MAG: LemA family protein [Exilispira sp.]